LKPSKTRLGELLGRGRRELGVHVQNHPPARRAREQEAGQALVMCVSSGVTADRGVGRGHAWIAAGWLLAEVLAEGAERGVEMERHV
jgi:hypothetical protein